MKTDNANFCENHFWLVLVYNGDELIGLSEKASQIVKHRYISGSLNVESTLQIDL